MLQSFDAIFRFLVLLKTKHCVDIVNLVVASERLVAYGAITVHRIRSRPYRQIIGKNLRFD